VVAGGAAIAPSRVIAAARAAAAAAAKCLRVGAQPMLTRRGGVAGRGGYPS
jgi:hypothetical protein